MSDRREGERRHGDRRSDQMDKAEQLQDLLLQNLIDVLNSGEATAADRAVCYKLLKENGWSLDPALIPQSVRDKLTAKLDPEDLDDDVIPIRRAG